MKCLSERNKEQKCKKFVNSLGAVFKVQVRGSEYMCVVHLNGY